MTFKEIVQENKIEYIDILKYLSEEYNVITVSSEFCNTYLKMKDKIIDLLSLFRPEIKKLIENSEFNEQIFELKEDKFKV